MQHLPGFRSTSAEQNLHKSWSTEVWQFGNPTELQACLVFVTINKYICWNLCRWQHNFTHFVQSSIRWVSFSSLYYNDSKCIYMEEEQWWQDDDFKNMLHGLKKGLNICLLQALNMQIISLSCRTVASVLHSKSITGSQTQLNKTVCIINLDNILYSYSQTWNI